MATKRYRKSNKNREITYEDIKDLNFNSLTDEELEQYGLGSWLKKNASWLAPVAGIGAGIATGGLLLGPGLAAGATAGAAAGGFSAAGATMGAGIGSSLGSSVGGAVTNNYNQDQAIAAQNAQNKQTNAYTQAQNQLQMLQGNTPQETMGVVRRCGGKLRRMAKGGPVKHYLTTSSGEREISPEELAEVQRYLGIQQKINNYYTGKYKSSIDKFTKLGINTPQAYADYIAKNPKEALAAEDYNSLYKGAGLSKEEIDFYDPLRNKYFTPGEVQGSLEGMKDRVTDTAFGGRNLFAGLKLGLKEMPMKIETPANPYSYEPFRGYPNIQIGYTMDKTGGARTPSVFRNAAGQEVLIDPKKGLIPEEYPELTKDMQYAQPKKPLSQMRFRKGGRIQKPTDPPKVSEKTELSYLNNLEYLNNLLEEYRSSDTISSKAKNYMGIVRDNLEEELPVSFESIEDPKNYNEVTYLEELMNRAKPNITRENIDILAQDNTLQTLPQKLSILRNSNIYQSDADSLKKYAPEFYKLHKINYVKPFLKKRQFGGTINYNGQYHEGPDGGVPVDAMGNPNYYNPVALVEKGEVSYTGKDGEPYIFSDTLNLSKKNTFANEAKRTQSKYKLRMNGGKINDPIARKGYDLDMESLKSKQEELRDAMNIVEEEEMAKGGWIQKAINPKHKGYCTPMTKSTCTPHRKALARRFKSGDLSKEYGGNLPMYWDGSTLPQLVTPVDNTAAMDEFVNQIEMDYPSRVLPNLTPNVISNNVTKLPTGNDISKTINAETARNSGWTPYSGAGWESAIGLAAPIAGNIINMIGAKRRRGKGRITVPESGPSPTPISLERERASARELANVARANTRRALKGGTSAQQYMANVGAAEAGIQRNLGNQLGESYQREELMNSNLSQEERARLDKIREMKLQADMYNSQLGMIEDAQRSQYINNIINAVNQWGADMSKSKQNAMFMQMLNPNIRIQQRPRYRSWMGRNFGPKDTRVWEDLND